MDIKSSIYIWSLGHGAKPLNVFLNKLKEYKIDLVIDARSYPVSRYHPHYSKTALHRTLATETIKYLWLGEHIGGRKLNTNYDQTIDKLTELAKQGTRLCLLCSETDFRKCHRFTVLTPSFEERGLLVVHIQYNEKRNRRNK